jgi:hypothetical protein
MKTHNFTASAKWLTLPACERFQRVGSNEWFAFRGSLTLEDTADQGTLLDFPKSLIFGD